MSDPSPALVFETEHKQASANSTTTRASHTSPTVTAAAAGAVQTASVLGKRTRESFLFGSGGANVSVNAKAEESSPRAKRVRLGLDEWMTMDECKQLFQSSPERIAKHVLNQWAGEKEELEMEDDARYGLCRQWVQEAPYATLTLKQSMAPTPRAPSAVTTTTTTAANANAPVAPQSSSSSSSDGSAPRAKQRKDRLCAYKFAPHQGRGPVPLPSWMSAFLADLSTANEFAITGGAVLYNAMRYGGASLVELEGPLQDIDLFALEPAWNPNRNRAQVLAGLVRRLQSFIPVGSPARLIVERLARSSSDASLDVSEQDWDVWNLTIRESDKSQFRLQCVFRPSDARHTRAEDVVSQFDLTHTLGFYRDRQFVVSPLAFASWMLRRTYQYRMMLKPSRWYKFRRLGWTVYHHRVWWRVDEDPRLDRKTRPRFEPLSAARSAVSAPAAAAPRSYPLAVNLAGQDVKPAADQLELDWAPLCVSTSSSSVGAGAASTGTIAESNPKAEQKTVSAATTTYSPDRLAPLLPYTKIVLHPRHLQLTADPDAYLDEMQGCLDVGPDAQRVQVEQDISSFITTIDKP